MVTTVPEGLAATLRPFIVMALGILFLASGVGAAESPPGCPFGDCGLRNAAPYPNIIITHVGRSGSQAEMNRLYQWAKSGVWRDFGDGEADYLGRNQLFILSVDGVASPVMVHMSRSEYERVSFAEGDLVRYIPHVRGAHPGIDESLYSDLAGCIAVVCRASDKACQAQYHTGVFRRADGRQIDFKTEIPIAGGVAIDPASLLPQATPAAP